MNRIIQYALKAKSLTYKFKTVLEKKKKMQHLKAKIYASKAKGTAHVMLSLVLSIDDECD